MKKNYRYRLPVYRPYLLSLAQHSTGLPSYTNIGPTIYLATQLQVSGGGNNVPGHTASTQTNDQQLLGVIVLHRQTANNLPDLAVLH